MPRPGVRLLRASVRIASPVLRLLVITRALTLLAYDDVNLRLKYDWAVSLPASFVPGNYLSAVCPNGDLYTASKDGRIISIDREGHISARSGRLEFALRTIACSPVGNLYIAGETPDHTDHLLVFGPAPDYRLLFSSRLNISVLSMAVGQDRIFVAGFLQNSTFPLHVMSLHGNIQRSFGESGGARADPVLADGYLLWDTENLRLLFAPRKLPEVQVYDAEGTQLQVKGLGPNQPASVQWRKSAPETTGIGLLRAGAILIESATESAQGRHLLLNLLDGKLQPIAKVNIEEPQLLAGGDQKYGIYFVTSHRIVHAQVLNRLDEKRPLLKRASRLAYIGR